MTSLFALHFMTTETFDGVRLTTKASVYLDGECVGHGFILPDDTKKSVDVVLPAILTFGTAAAEIMGYVGGSCECKLDGADGWETFGASGSLQVPANSKFDIRATGAYHYVCHHA